MAIAGGSNIEYRKDEKTRYVEEDDVKDITKEDLKSLKSTLKEEETDLDTQLTKINDNVENIFDGFIMNKRETSVTLTKADGTTITDTPQNIVKGGVQDNLDALANYVIDNSGYVMELDKIKNEEVKTELKAYTFELNDLRKEIAAESGSEETGEGNAILSDRVTGTTEKTEKKETKYESKNDYIDPYKQTGITYPGISENMDIANIYKDNKVPKYMEKVFDDGEKEEIRRGTFRINLGKEDGLAGIVIAIREAVASGSAEDADPESASYKLYQELTEKGILTSEEPIELNISKTQLKELIDGGFLTYEDTKALSFNEKGKVAKILSNALRSDLDTFASLLQSKSKESKAVKEWYNADLMVKNKSINEDNVLEFLCDFNSDAQISAEYKKKNNKEQKNQGDVGPLFGQQVMFTIEQAIKVKNVELGDPAGEQLVINNIIKNMQISDSRELDDIQKLPFTTMEGDITKCTKENLATLFNGDEGQGILPMPEMKSFFLSSIETINGGSEEVNPDLYDTLVGKESQSIIDLVADEVKLKQAIADILEKSKDPKIIEMIRVQGLVRVRQTIFTSIMTALDNVTVSFNDGKTSSTLQAAGISKGRETRQLKKQILETAVETLITTGIHWTETGELLLSIGYSKGGYLGENKKTKYERGVGTGVGISSDVVGIFVDLSGGIAEQYNYKRVINADLSKIKSAKYLGIEGGARAGLDFTKEKAIDLEASVGLNRQKDREAGIDQIDKQYGNVSAEIFTIEKFSAATIKDKATFQAYLYTRIAKYKKDSAYGDFVTTNEQHLKDSADFIARYMDANELFGTTSILAKKSESDQKLAMNTLLDILHSGVQEQRRHDVIAGLHGKIALTKLSFGLTTNTLTLDLKKKKTEAPTASGTAGETPEAGNIEGGSASNEGDNLGQDRLGICGFYIGARISTWKNSYVPNDKQYLFTEYETGQGVGAELFDNPGKDLDTYGKYLEALYNDSKGRLTCKKNPTSNNLIITFEPEEGSDLTLAQFLNIHATTEAEKNFSLKGNVLIIGNVGDMAAYTITQANGVRRILCLGSKKLNEATRVTGDLGVTTVDAMKPVTETNKARTQEKIKTDIIANMVGEGVNVETAKKETAAFFDVDGKLITPTGTEWTGKTIKFEPDTIKDKTLTQGTLLIQKNADGISYIVTLDKDTPAKELTVIYRDKVEYDAALLKEQEKPENRAAVTSTEVKTLFSFADAEMSKAKTEIATLLASLEELENTDPQAYADFLLDASTSDGGKIDDEQLSASIVHLEILIAKDKNPTTFDALKGFLDGQNGEVKSYIVDRMKQILAREPLYKTMTIGSILGRHSGWEKVSGPTSALSAALQTEMKTRRTELKKTYATEKYSTNPTIDPNLIGFTAFYRPLAQKYSLTSLGETSYQGELMTITENKDTAQAWFLENLVGKYEINRLATSLEAQFLAQGATVDILKGTQEKTLKQLELLIQGKEITIDSGDKISIDLDWVFYLLGDCCNESLGMKIKNIKIQKFIPGTVVAGRYAATGITDKEYKGGMDLYTKSHSISNRVITKEMKVGVKGFFKKRDKKPSPDANAGETKDPGDPHAGDGNNETQDPGNPNAGSGDNE